MKNNSTYVVGLPSLAPATNLDKSDRFWTTCTKEETHHIDTYTNQNLK